MISSARLKLDLRLAIAASFLIGCAYSVILLHWSAVSGSTEFWDFPHGISGSDLDIQNALSGYYWFVQDAWRWPLLQVVKPNWPEGMNAELFDIVPVVSLLGKVLFHVTGILLNPFPLWITACFGLNAVTLTLLVRSLGERSFTAAIVAASLAALAPVVQYRFGHMALMAHWVLIACLAIYFGSRRRMISFRDLASVVLLCALATSIHLYLYVMTAAVASALLGQAVITRRISLLRGCLGMSGILLAGLGPLAVFGLLGSMEVAVWSDLSRYSMNMLSPVWPQSSGLFAWTRSYWLTRGIISATPGQYEGFDYLGAGSLLLVVIGLLACVKQFARIATEHIVLVAALVVLLLWSLSPSIYIGPYLLFSYDLPAFLRNTVLSWFRSSGRFFWPIGWLLVAVGVAATFRVFSGGRAIALGALAMLLQFTDVQPWISRFQNVREQRPSLLGASQQVDRLKAVVAETGSTAVLPPIFCSAQLADYEAESNVTAMQVQLVAARANARMPNVYISRAKDYCSKSPDLNRTGVVVMIRSQLSAELRSSVEYERECFDSGVVEVCVRKPEPQ